tara:strand:- start:72 stop:434 length:363 start_codon:yes stop_codon:yes gene_type:complete
MKEQNRERHPFFKAGVDHFESKGTKVIEVPEWGEDDDNPAVIYADPLTMREAAKVYRGIQKDDLTAHCDVLIMKARDKDGNRVFSPADKMIMLSKLDPGVISRISSEILETLSFEDAEKN